jgi:N-acetylglucosamine repressor
MYVHPSHLRLANRRRACALLLAEGGSTRASLARSLGLSAVTAGKVVDELIDEGLVEETDDAVPAAANDAPPARGRPARRLRLADGPTFAAVEIGASETRVAGVALGGRVKAERRFATPASLPKFLDAVRAAAAAVDGRPRAVLASVPGVVDEAAGRVVFSPNLHWSEGTELLEGLGRLFRAPVVAVQEVRALALGLVAAGEAPEPFLLLEFGDGVGGAIVAAGEGGSGERMPLIGEIGHTRVPGAARRCGCGGTGCVETIASRAGLLRSCRAAARSPRLSWDAVVARVAARGVEPWLAETVASTAVVASGAVNLLGVRDVVLMGDLPDLGPDVVARFADDLRTHALPARFGPVVCRAAPRRRILGLAYAALDRLLLPPPETAAERGAAKELERAAFAKALKRAAFAARRRSLGL